jgi:oligopeptide transport system ATP-binding protein
MADDVMVMYGGKQVEYGTAHEVFYESKHPYAWGLLDSLPRHDIDEKSELEPIKGSPPSLINIPPGCAFHPRCPYAKERCTKEIPELRDLGDGHLVACHFAGQPGFVRGAASDVEVA